MKKRVIAAVVLGLALAGVGFATNAANADVTLCLDAHVVVNGQEIVNEDQCQVVTPPALP